MTNRQGVVWYGDRRVGTLREDDSHTLHFAYDTGWLDKNGFPISIRLPLANGDMEADAHAYFEGLLPEGKVRQRICRRLGIDITDDSGLLLAIGEDCAGALSILPAGTAPGVAQVAPATLTLDQINRLVRSLGEDASVLTGENQRFSLAGVQQKQPLIFDGVKYALPDRYNPSSHILKFETVRRVCFAEYMANDMARRIELPVVNTEFLNSETADGSIPYLRIERYDRSKDASGNFVRLHQEDILQALGHTSIFKYQHGGGPSIGEIAELLRKYTARPIESLSCLRDWQIFNFLIGNWDGHAKNLALLYTPGESVPTLAPFYDLVAIEFFNLLSPGYWAREMAFNIGEHNVPERITRLDWQAFAKDIGMPPKRLLARLEELALVLPDVADAALQAFRHGYANEEVHEQLLEMVRRRCHWALNSVIGK